MRYQYYRLGHIINMKSLGDHLYIFVKILGKYKGKILVVESLESMSWFSISLKAP